MPYRDHPYEFKIEVLDAYEAALPGTRKDVLKQYSLHASTVIRWRKARESGELQPPTPRESIRCVAVGGRCPREAKEYRTLKLCRRHYYQVWRNGMAGCSQCGAYTEPNRRECDTCIGEEFKEYGFDLIGTYVNTHMPVAVKCRECEKSFPIRLNNLREAQKRGTRGCSSCLRLTDEQAREILSQAGLRKVGPFLTTRVPVDCICTRCNQPYRARVGHIHHRLQRGLRVWGCQPCALQAIRVVELTEQEALEEFYELGVKDVQGWVNAGTAVEGRCIHCNRRTTPRLTVLRRSSTGVACASCNGRGFWSIPSLRKNRQLAEAPAFIYIYEFTDFDGTLFHKVGITRDSNGWSGRLDEHERFEGEPVQLASSTRIVCRMAELLILRHVGPNAYEPSEDRLAAGHSECYLPQGVIDLEAWLQIATAKLEEGE